MAERQGVRIGERFKSVGHNRGEVFEVGSILAETGAIPHAKLFSITNPTDHKLISIEALRDTRLYLPVDVRGLDLDDGPTGQEHEPAALGKKAWRLLQPGAFWR